jgi:BirA family biotin operon repressor/biotin-[acetyl-CoA-carboxylase] ligase
MRRIAFSFILLTSFAQASFIESKFEFEKVTIVRRHYGELQSTQDTIYDHRNDVSATQWVMVSADSQKGGKGMWERTWVSPPGNVFVTFAFPLAEHFKYLRYVSQIAGVVVCDTLKDYSLNPQLRWVNNILIGDEKIGGILCRGEFNDGPFIAIVGIGINITMDLETAQAIDQPVTSMRLKLGEAPNVDEVLTKLSANFYKRFVDVTTFPTTFNEYSNLLAYKGQEVTVYTGPNNTGANTHFTGIFEYVTLQGYIKLKGIEKPFPSGEIVSKPK